MVDRLFTIDCAITFHSEVKFPRVASVSKINVGAHISYIYSFTTEIYRCIWRKSRSSEID